ncbi:unnamed protein product [Pleuronectes platessa]|uniref:Uncharacterized protein n=1 Tax=Pleuronectes platessa TaxID=8262 RepID=A0A9N7U7Y7_PLEPL|nr:unnamed protein product [Pleuronectes platessa]
MTPRSPSCCEHTLSHTEALINLKRSTLPAGQSLCPNLLVTVATVVLLGARAFGFQGEEEAGAERIKRLKDLEVTHMSQILTPVINNRLHLPQTHTQKSPVNRSYWYADSLNVEDLCGVVGPPLPGWKSLTSDPQAAISSEIQSER